MKQDVLEFGEKNSNAEYRKSVGAIIYDPISQKVLGLDWHLYPVYGIVQGGQDDNESEEETLMREIIEETGYTHFRIGEKLGPNIISYFFADNKNMWRKLELACYIVVLENTDQISQKLEDNEKFEIKWVDIDTFIEMAENHIPSRSQNSQGLGEFLKRAKKLIK